MVEQFGIEAVIRLFKSEAIELHLDWGHIGIHEGRRDRPEVVLELIACRPVQPTMTDRHFSTLRESYDVRRLSHWRSLRSALRRSIDEGAVDAR